MSTNPSKIKYNIDGIILLNKPTGISSNKALQKVKHLIKAKKAGHTGALDPLATGLLPLCFGQATKLADYLLGDNKTYIVTAKLGERTTTSDSDGEIISTKPVPTLNTDQMLEYLNSFQGNIEQTPSMYSALKYQGKPYYFYARNNIDIPRVTRNINIYKINLLNFSDNELTLKVYCSKGTYIRTLIDDLGELIGCGAHVIALHRDSIENIKAPMIELSDLENILSDIDITNNPMPYLIESGVIKPVHQLLNFDCKVLTDKELEGLTKGTLKTFMHVSNSRYLCLNSTSNQLFGLAKLDNDDLYHITHRFIFGFGNYN